MRAGIYSYRISDPKVFYQKISGTRASYTVPRLEGQLRNTIIGQMTDMFGNAAVNFIDMAAHQSELGYNMLAAMRPCSPISACCWIASLVENISLPEELKVDQRIGMNTIGDMGPLHAVPGRAIDADRRRERRRRNRRAGRSASALAC